MMEIKKHNTKVGRKKMLMNRKREKKSMKDQYVQKDVPLTIRKYFKQNDTLYFLKEFLDCMNGIVIKFNNNENVLKKGNTKKEKIKKFKFDELTLTKEERVVLKTHKDKKIKKFKTLRSFKCLMSCYGINFAESLTDFTIKAYLKILKPNEKINEEERIKRKNQKRRTEKDSVGQRNMLVKVLNRIKEERKCINLRIICVDLFSDMIKHFWTGSSIPRWTISTQILQNLHKHNLLSKNSIGFYKTLLVIIEDVKCKCDTVSMMQKKRAILTFTRIIIRVMSIPQMFHDMKIVGWSNVKITKSVKSRITRCISYKMSMIDTVLYRSDPKVVRFKKNLELKLKKNIDNDGCVIKIIPSIENIVIMFNRWSFGKYRNEKEIINQSDAIDKFVTQMKISVPLCDLNCLLSSNNKEKQKGVKKERDGTSKTRRVLLSNFVFLQKIKEKGRKAKFVMNINIKPKMYNMEDYELVYEEETEEKT